MTYANGDRVKGIWEEGELLDMPVCETLYEIQTQVRWTKYQSKNYLLTCRIM